MIKYIKQHFTWSRGLNCLRKEKRDLNWLCLCVSWWKYKEIEEDPFLPWWSFCWNWLGQSRNPNWNWPYGFQNSFVLGVSRGIFKQMNTAMNYFTWVFLLLLFSLFHLDLFLPHLFSFFFSLLFFFPQLKGFQLI